MGKSLNIVWSVLTALITLSTTALMGVVIMTTHWEAITYSQSAVESLLSVEDPENKTLVRPLLDGRVIVVSKENDKENELLVKMHAGLWATCYDLTAQEISDIVEMFDGNVRGVQILGNNTCLSLQTSIEEDDENLTTAHHRHLRLQNLCISSSLVCIIILSACLVVFWVGFILRQVPPVLIVSVLYVLAAVFASFALSIMRAKRLPLPRSALLRLDASSSVPGVGDLVLDGQIDSKYYPARSFHPSWSFYVGWIGVSTCLLSSVCVYTLSRLMRYPPFLKVA